MESEAERITPEKAIEIFKKDGIDVTIAEARIILEFLYPIAEIIVDQYLEKSKKI